MSQNIINKSIFFRKIKYFLALTVIVIVTVILYLIIVNQDVVISHKRSQNDEVKKKDSHYLSLKATNPDLVGANIEHGPYFIQAKEVYEVNEEIMFDKPKVRMMIKHEDWLNLISLKAKLKVSDSYLTMTEEVKANINNEYFLENNSTDIFEKESKIRSQVKTKLFNSETFIISDKGFLLDYASQIIELFGRVNLESKKGGKGKSINIKSDKLIGYWQNKTGEFIGNVVLNKEKSTVIADKMTIFLNEKTKQIDKVIANGNVKIKDNLQTCYGDEAIYVVAKSTLLLSGKVKLERAGNEMLGNSLRYNFNNKKADLTSNDNNKKERVKAIIIPKKIHEKN